jgi:hypothetical protein
MATSKYSDPILLGYYVFDLPNGQVLDMCSPDQVVLPDGDLSNLPARYVERIVDPIGFVPNVGRRRSPADVLEARLKAAAKTYVTADELASIGEKTHADELEATLQSCDRLAVELKLASHEPTADDLLGLGKLSDEEMELFVFGNVQRHAERI